MALPIDEQRQRLAQSLAQMNKAFHRVSGCLLAHLIGLVPTLQALADSDDDTPDRDTARSILNAAAHAGDGNRTIDVNTQACEFLLKLATPPESESKRKK